MTPRSTESRTAGTKSLKNLRAIFWCYKHFSYKKISNTKDSERKQAIGVTGRNNAKRNIPDIK